MKFNNIDLQGLGEIQNAKFQRLSSAPSNPTESQFYYNTTDHTLYVYDGTNWINALSQGGYTFQNGVIQPSGTMNVELNIATGANAGNVTLTANSNGLAGSVGAASTSAAGVIEIATDTEASTGTAENLAVNPKQLAAAVSGDIELTDLSIDSGSANYLGYDNTTGKFSAKVDTTVGTVSTNLVTSGAVDTALGGKVDANTAITGATKCKITYDSKGLVTAGADLAASDIPNLSLSKITDVTATAAEVNVLDGITATTTELNYTDGVTSNIQTQLDNKLGVKPDGTNNLIDSGNKINLVYVPDVLLGQMLYAGTFVPSTGVATLSTNAKTKLGVTSNTITLTNDTTATTGYEDNEGNYYLASASGTFATISFETGDWLLSTGSGWNKIDNTDAVTGVKGNAESTYRIGNVNITADNVLPTQTSNSGKYLTTDGTNCSWGTVDALPTQTSQSGKFLTTNGSSASWAAAVTPDGTQTLTNKTIDADDNTISDLTTSNLKSGVLQTTVRAVASASDTAIPSEKAVASAIDNQARIAEMTQNSNVTPTGGIVTWIASFVGKGTPVAVASVQLVSTNEEIIPNKTSISGPVVTIELLATDTIPKQTYHAWILYKRDV